MVGGESGREEEHRQTVRQASITSKHRVTKEARATTNEGWGSDWVAREEGKPTLSHRLPVKYGTERGKKKKKTKKDKEKAADGFPGRHLGHLDTSPLQNMAPTPLP